MRNFKNRIVTMALLVFMISFSIVPACAENTAPEITASSAIVYCGDTGEVIMEKNADEKMEPASMTKLMTCLLAVENLELDQVVEIPAEVTSIPPTKAYLQAGEKITVEELMYAALLSSANDAATALAIEAGGSVENFAAMMNKKAESLGCTNTNFTNPSGLSDENQYSTARDMAIIAREALGNETVRKISGTVEHIIPETNMYKARNLRSFNMFLYGGEHNLEGETLTVEKYEGVFGGKTGSLSKEYCTMVTGLDCDGFEIYTVVMGTTMKNRFADMKALMDYGKANISKYAAFEKGADFGKAKLTGGATNRVKAIAAEAGYVNLPEGASASLVTTKCIYADSLFAPIEKGQKVGVVEIYIADDLYRTVDLVAAEPVAKGWFLSDFGITNLQTVIIGAALLAIIVFTLTILILRMKNKKKRAQRRREKLMEEARRQLEREEDLKRRNWPY